MTEHRPVADVADLLRRLDEQLTLSDMGYSERFDYQAERFYRETGFMAPGKSVPVEMSSSQRDEEREPAWRAFQDKLSDEWKATIREARGRIAQMAQERDDLIQSLFDSGELLKQATQRKDEAEAAASQEPTREWYRKRCAWYSAELDRLNAAILAINATVSAASPD